MPLSHRPIISHKDGLTLFQGFSVITSCPTPFHCRHCPGRHHHTAAEWGESRCSHTGWKKKGGADWVEIWLRSDKLCLLWNFKCNHSTFLLAEGDAAHDVCICYSRTYERHGKNTAKLQWTWLIYYTRMTSPALKLLDTKDQIENQASAVLLTTYRMIWRRSWVAMDLRAYF